MPTREYFVQLHMNIILNRKKVCLLPTKTIRILISQSFLSQTVIYIHKVFNPTDTYIHTQKDQNRVFTFLRYLFSYSLLLLLSWKTSDLVHSQDRVDKREEFTRIDLGVETLGGSGHFQKKAFSRQGICLKIFP